MKLKKDISNKTFITLLITLIFLFILSIVIIINMNSKNNHGILLKLTENVLLADGEVNSKIYVSVYDGQEVKKYESSYNKDLSSGIKELENKIDVNLYKKRVRLDVTSYKYQYDSLLDMSNSKSTVSYYYDDGKVYELEKYQVGKSIDINSINIKNDVLDKTYTYMLNQIKDDGKFIYEVNLKTGEVSTDYNIIRHCGSVWSLIEYYNFLGKDANKEDLNKIKTAYNYIFNNRLLKNGDDTYYILTDKSKSKVGSNALMILASIELYKATGDNAYLDDANKMAKGLIYLQDQDGAFYHTINNNFEKSNKNESEIYNGEINFALVTLYGVTKNEIYLNSVLKSMDYYIATNSINTSNQWFSYFYAELIKYVKDPKYIQTFIKNMKINLKTIDNKFGRCDMEYLGSSYQFLNELINNYDKYSLENIISKDEINSLIKHLVNTYISRAQKGLSNFASIENSMYLYDINTYIGAFFESNYIARIDVSQHNLAGYRLFYEDLYNNNKLINNKTESTNNELTNAYVELAKLAVETYVSEGKTISVPDNLPKEMYEKCKNGVYVGIHNKDELRGCKGTFSPTGTIAEEVIKYAIIAATKDSRFTPIRKDEFADLIYEISIIGDSEKVNDISELDAFKYGITISKGDKSATMLPNRATISTVEDQIKKTLKKAGLSENETDYTIYRYETVSYKLQ